MIWFILLRLIIVIIGLLLIFKTTSFRLSSWIFDSNLKSNIRRTRLFVVKIFGILIVLIVIMDYFRYFIIEYYYAIIN